MKRLITEEAASNNLISVSQLSPYFLFLVLESYGIRYAACLTLVDMDTDILPLTRFFILDKLLKHLDLVIFLVCIYGVQSKAP